ncbi:DUF4343 domain-containing protein [Chitinophaga silvatica]|uniref:DUF4343 domain-containing protein n=1 Tax=Chitinophaga silvatica TaxID=2282649 RepID=A0A3E1YES2_9BACT|nr:ATP-grasp domain-containing protein [Chitinophaga silvatica]RFS24979.1 DUF4343 domain-containing protein [Chitinophaga silvatica]
MPVALQDIQWVVQENLTNIEYINDLQAACKKAGVTFQPIRVIPFSGQLPDFDAGRKSIFYGSTTLCNLVAANEQLKAGLFFDPESFSMENYFQQWGSYMLNYGATITDFKTLLLREEDPNTLFFIRPVDDGKTFAGVVKRFADLTDWCEQLQHYNETRSIAESKIVVGKPYEIEMEWRLWIVEGKVVASSRYRTYFKLTKEKGCPPSVKDFAEARCLEYMPYGAFVMDIGKAGDDLFIIECNCINAAGFYHGDINAIVSEVSRFFASSISR